MKKLIIISALFLFGVFSVSAQSSWEVLVTWSVTPGGDCQFDDIPGNGFKVAITIYDEANDVIVVNNMEDDVSETTFLYTFDVQSAVQTHCNDNTLTYEPDYIVYAAVYMGNSGELEPICSTKDTKPDNTCSDFSTTGVEMNQLLFD